MENLLSPKYKMKLIQQVYEAIESQYSQHLAHYYIKKFHSSDDWNWENFRIHTDQVGNLNLFETLHEINDDILLKMAIDIGVETPGFIPAMPEFVLSTKHSFNSAYDSFQKATKEVMENPNIAIGLANSTLESIIKEILLDPNISKEGISKLTLYKLTEHVLREFSLYPNDSVPIEIKTIGSSLLSINRSIEQLRSTKTSFHGKSNNEYLIDESMYACFVVNAVATVGLFLNSFYRHKYPLRKQPEFSDDDLPF